MRMKKTEIDLHIVVQSILIGIGIIGSLVLNSYYAFIIGQIALLATAGIGLNILIGLSGQFSFGHAGFYAIGAYLVAICTSHDLLDFWLALPLGVVLCCIVGAMLAMPAFSVKGPYLAMVTIAFGVVVEQMLVEAETLTGGQNGILAIAPISLAGQPLGDRSMAIFATLAASLACAAYHILSKNGWGLAMQAVRDSENAAAAIGINPFVAKVVAFTLSAGFCGLAGGLSAPLNSFVIPHSFGLNFSVLLVLVVVIGGLGARSGALLGAIVVGLLPEFLSSLEAYRAVAYGVLVLTVLWLAPSGIAGLLPNRAGPNASPRVRKPISAIVEERNREDLSANGLELSFGGVKALDGLSLTIPAGTVTALIGPNGAGKSTIINILSGFYKADAGQKRLGDTLLPAGKAWVTAVRGIARTYQTSALFDSLSARQNVFLALRKGKLGSLLAFQGKSDADMQEKARQLLWACGFEGDADATTGNLAHVDRRFVEIARAIALDPDVLLLDEPAAGLSQAEKRTLTDLLRNVAQCGIGIGLIEHDMGLVTAASDQVVALCAGEIIASGAPTQVLEDPVVRTAYLGERGAARRAATPVVAARPVLAAYALHAGYGSIEVLHGIDFEVREGEAIALLGANGAGKSTLMRVLSGLMPPRKGQLRLFERNVNDTSPLERVRSGLALVPEGRQVFPELTVRDNLRLGAFTSPRGMDARISTILKRFPRLLTMLDRRAGLLSGGEQQMLAIGRALMAQPRILLLDEPSMGLSPQATSDMFDQLETLKGDGLAMVIVDQMADRALAMSSRTYVLGQGKVALTGASSDLMKDTSLEELYLPTDVREPDSAHA